MLIQLGPDSWLLELFILIRFDIGTVPTTPGIREIVSRIDRWITTSEVVCSRAVLAQEQRPITAAGRTGLRVFRLKRKVSILNINIERLIFALATKRASVCGKA